MIHPTFNALNLEDMANSAEPQNDREWMFSLRGEVQRIADAVDRLVKTVYDLEEKKLSAMEEEISEMKRAYQQAMGGWKTAIIIATSIATLISIAAALRTFF